MQTLKGKRVILTGGGTGTGQGIALKLASEGAQVCYSYHTGDPNPLKTLRQIKRARGQAEAFPVNLENREEGVAFVAQAIKRMGGVDAMICNAGPTIVRPFLEMTPEIWDRLHHIHLRTAYFCAQAAVRAMPKSGGRVIFIGSVHGHASCPNFSSYASAKGGIAGLVRALGVELAPRRITVNSIAPGVIEVESYFREYPGYKREEVAKEVPMGRVGFPRDIAAVAAFLLTPGADFLTGQTLVVDGGMLARLAFMGVA